MQSKKLYTLVFGLSLLSSCAFAQESSKLYDQCYVINVQNKESGYSCLSQNTEKQGDTSVVITKKHIEETFSNYNMNVNFASDITYKEDISGKPISVEAIINSFKDKYQYKITFKTPQYAVLTYSKNGEETSEELTSDDRILLPYALKQLYQAKLTDKISYSTLDFNNDFRLVKVNAEKVGSETLLINDQPKELTKYKFFIDSIPNIENYEWIDKDGNVEKYLFSVFDMEHIATQKNKILGLNDPKNDFYKKIAPANLSLSALKDVGQITYKINIPSELDEKDIIIQDERQRIIQGKDNIVYLKVKVDDSIATQKTGSSMNDFLKPNTYINSQSELIKQTTQKIILTEKNPSIIAKKLNKWVALNIANNNYKFNFSNAETTLKNAKGDPMEKALLLASMLRSANIPAQIVIGLSYAEAPKNAFMYDVWVKAYTDKWINLNPVNPEEVFKPTHIALYESDFNSNKDKTKIVSSMLNNLSEFKIEVLNFNSASANTKQVKLTQPQQYDDTNLLSILKNSNDLTKKINLSSNDNASNTSNEIELRERTQTEYFNIGLYNYARADIQSALENFKKASDLVPFNDNFADIGFAYKMASLGLFSKAKSQLHNVGDSKIWKNYIDFMQQMYFPSKMPSEKTELTLAKANALAAYAESPDEAIAILNKNQNMFKETDYAYYVQAKAYMAKKNYAKSIENIEKAVKLSPKTLNYQRERINVYIDAKQYKKAEKYLNELKKNPNVNNKLQKILDEQSFLIKSKLEKKTENINFNLAKLSFSKGDYQKAEELLGKEDFNSSKNALRGDIHYKLNEMDKAQTYYQQALKKNSKNTDALYGLGNIYFSQKKYENALVCYLKALNNNKNSDKIMISIGNTYKYLSKEKLSYEYYSNALELNPQNSDALYNLSLMDANNGEKEKSKTELFTLLSYNPVYTPAWLELAKREIAEENTFNATLFLRPVGHIAPNNYMYYYYLGAIDKINNDYARARENFKKALSINPDFEEAKKELVELN